MCDSLSVSCHLRLPEDITLHANKALRGAGGALLITNFTRLQGKLFGCAAKGNVTSCLEQKASRRRLQEVPGAPNNNTAVAGYGHNIATAAAKLVAFEELTSLLSGSAAAGPEASLAPGQLLQRAFMLQDALGHHVNGSISDAGMGLRVRYLQHSRCLQDFALLSSMCQAIPRLDCLLLNACVYTACGCILSLSTF